MPTVIDQLPDDVEQLKQLVVELAGQVTAGRNEVITARLQIEKLKLQNARSRRLQYGRKS